jgi:hypothetical protein
VLEALWRLDLTTDRPLAEVRTMVKAHLDDPLVSAVEQRLGPSLTQPLKRAGINGRLEGTRLVAYRPGGYWGAFAVLRFVGSLTQAGDGVRLEGKFRPRPLMALAVAWIALITTGAAVLGGSAGTGLCVALVLASAADLVHQARRDIVYLRERLIGLVLGSSDAQPGK